jgi:hypothetical protein
MICIPCAILPLTAIGLGLTFSDAYFIGLLIIIFSLSLYLYLYDIKKCKSCRKD